MKITSILLILTLVLSSCGKSSNTVKREIVPTNNTAPQFTEGIENKKTNIIETTVTVLTDTTGTTPKHKTAKKTVGNVPNDAKYLLSYYSVNTVNPVCGLEDEEAEKRKNKELVCSLEDEKTKKEEGLSETEWKLFSVILVAAGSAAAYCIRIFRKVCSKISKTGIIDLQREVHRMQGQQQKLEEKVKLTKEEKETLKKLKKTIREALKELKERGVTPISKGSDGLSMFTEINYDTYDTYAVLNNPYGCHYVDYLAKYTLYNQPETRKRSKERSSSNSDKQKEEIRKKSEEKGRQVWQEISKKIKEKIEEAWDDEGMYKTICGEVKVLGYHNDILYLGYPDGCYASSVAEYIEKVGYTGEIEWIYTGYGS